MINCLLKLKYVSTSIKYFSTKKIKKKLDIISNFKFLAIAKAMYNGGSI